MQNRRTHILMVEKSEAHGSLITHQGSAKWFKSKWKDAIREANTITAQGKVNGYAPFEDRDALKPLLDSLFAVSREKDSPQFKNALARLLLPRAFDAITFLCTEGIRVDNPHEINAVLSRNPHLFQHAPQFPSIFDNLDEQRGVIHEHQFAE